MTLLSMNEITTFRWSFEQDVENYQQAGYRAIGVWRQKLTDWDENQAVELLAGSGLAVSNLLWAGGFTGSDGRTPADSIGDAADALRLAAAIGAGCLVVYPGGRNNHTFRHAGRLLRGALDELLPLAEAVEVPLAIEPMHVACAADWTFLTDLDSIVTLLNEYRSPCLKLAYDTYHFPFESRQRPMLAELAQHIGIVHLSDRSAPPTLDQERCLLGQGRLPLRETVATLQNAGYTGAFDVKLLGPEVESHDYWTVLEQSQLAFSEYAAAVGLHSWA
ncbi:MAG: sugar phosphate isomerase/epimerase [Planctomycetes bacterium]|nr:sugar phosphate isomerase/epimerase [Planctomycetota bacterium]